MDKTSKLGLNLPDKGFRDWDVPINENFNLIDSKVAVLGLDNVFTGINTFTKTIKSNYTLALESITNQTTFEKPAEAPTENKNIGRINFLASDSGYSMGHLLTYRNPSNIVITQIAARQSIDGVQKSCVLELGVDQDGNPITKVPVPEDTSNSTKIPTTSWVRKLFALLTGNNIFSGLNTFDSGSDISLQIKSNIIDNSVTPETDQFSNFIDMLDKNNVRIGRIFQRKRNNGTNGIFLQAWSGNTNYLLGVNSDGSTEAPTPPTADNSSQIATTAFFRNNMQVVTDKPSSPTAGVFYFVKE